MRSLQLLRRAHVHQGHEVPRVRGARWRVHPQTPQKRDRQTRSESGEISQRMNSSILENKKLIH